VDETAMFKKCRSGTADIKKAPCQELSCGNGGRGGIRTLEGRKPLPVFKTGAFNRSATLPNTDFLKARILRELIEYSITPASFF
jgi:hypothetical protein